MHNTLAAIAVLIASCTCAIAQAPTPIAPLPDDATVVAAQRWLGRALFLRGFYAGGDLKYDTAGKVEGSPAVVDWTLAAVDLQDAKRLDPATIELDGVRVAIRYNPDTQAFERHPQKAEPVRVLVATGRARSAADQLTATDPFEDTLAAIFSIGIDPALQHSMPEFWKHYFDPKAAWPPDGLEGQAIYPAKGSTPPAPAALVYPEVLHRTPSGSTPQADRDHIKAIVLVNLVVDAAGAPRRTTLIRPVGYGLDARTAQSIATWKFQPATLAGKAVPAKLDLSEDFTPAPPRPAPAKPAH